MTLTKNKKIIRAARAKARLHLRGALCVAVVIIGSLYVASETLSASPRSTIASEVRRLSNATAEELCQPSGRKKGTEGCNDFSGYPPFTTDGKPMSVNPYINGGMLVYIIGTMYTFMGLAVVCDEYFVPALEAIIEKYEINDDVAGATLMAAGGSAPELATSLIGTFVAKSNVGFGTIVGSAVFNVLFVIGCCAVFSKDILTLTWWPLFRDSLYYVLGLLMLYIFFQASSPNIIETWEALVLFGLYWGYVAVMANNQGMKKKVSKMLSKQKAETAPLSPADSSEKYVKAENGAAPKPGAPAKAKAVEKQVSNIFLRPSHFRVGVFHLVMKEDDPHEQLRQGVVQRVVGDVMETFKQIDDDNNGYIDAEEFSILINQLTSNDVTLEMAKEQAAQTIKEIDTDGDGHIDFEEFKAWYLQSETRVITDVHNAFNALDETHNGMIEMKDLRKVVDQMGMSEFLDDNQIVEALTYFKNKEDPEHPNKITFDNFREWYKKSMLWEKQVEMGHEDADREEDGDPIELEWPSTFKGRLNFIIWAPIMVPLYFTIPDCRAEKFKTYFPATFVLAITWVAIYSYLMVWWVTVIGDVIQVPIVIMGLTFLAAGTSVPDLLTSVIVARQGHGDMAVSSSIGSNIFDILVGLPVPWLLYCLINGGQIDVGGGNVRTEFFYSVGFSLVLLILMLISVIVTIAMSGWRMTKGLGYSMFGLYLCFVVIEIIRAYT